MTNFKTIAAYAFAALAAVVLFASGAFWASHRGRLDNLETHLRNESEMRVTEVAEIHKRLDALEHRLGRGQGAAP